MTLGGQNSYSNLKIKKKIILRKEIELKRYFIILSVTSNNIFYYSCSSGYRSACVDFVWDKN